jgi:hypothetical protein
VSVCLSSLQSYLRADATCRASGAELVPDDFLWVQQWNFGANNGQSFGKVDQQTIMGGMPPMPWKKPGDTISGMIICTTTAPNIFAKRTGTDGKLILKATVDGKVVKVLDDKGTVKGEITIPSEFTVAEATFSNGNAQNGSCPANCNPDVLFLKLTGVTPAPTFMVI